MLPNRPLPMLPSQTCRYAATRRHVKLTRGDHARTAFTDYLNRVPKRGAIETVHVDGERVKLRIDVVHPALISPRIIRDREETFPLRGLNPRASRWRKSGKAARNTKAKAATAKKTRKKK
jgi:hypothetical protein